ncbi:hypothetical protein STEG23_011269, partial [Scotinomys teguina]
KYKLTEIDDKKGNTKESCDHKPHINLNTDSKVISTSHLAEDENLWIASGLIWFDQPRPPDSSQTAPVKIGPSS